MKSLVFICFFVAVIAVASAQQSGVWGTIYDVLTGNQSWSQLFINLIQKVINFFSGVDNRLTSLSSGQQESRLPPGAENRLPPGAENRLPNYPNQRLYGNGPR